MQNKRGGEVYPDPEQTASILQEEMRDAFQVWNRCGIPRPY
jgi:hypothetical protein